MICVSELTVNDVALVPPNWNAGSGHESRGNPVPVRTTLVPPAVDPVFGFTLVMAGVVSYV